MIELITNKHNLSESDMTETVSRVKILLINSNDEILLGYSHHNYQFPGGHVEDGEELIDTVNREIEEETGINLGLKEAEYFAITKGYYKDWPEKGKNRKILIYYYEIKNDKLPVLENTKYTEHEKDGGFKLEFVPLKDVERVLKDNVEKYGDDKGIAREMLELLRLYKENKQL